MNEHDRYTSRYLAGLTLAYVVVLAFTATLLALIR